MLQENSSIKIKIGKKPNVRLMCHLIGCLRENGARLITDENPINWDKMLFLYVTGKKEMFTGDMQEYFDLCVHKEVSPWEVLGEAEGWIENTGEMICPAYMCI